MIEDVGHDARGILAPDVGLTRFTLDRHAPSATAARLVDRYWIVRWHLPAGAHHTQSIWPHPVTNVVFEDGDATAGGVATALFTRRLEGHGQVLGVMFRPAGFHPLLGAPMHTITDRTLSLADVLPGARSLAARVAEHDDVADAVPIVDDVLAAHVPAAPHPAEDTMRLAERVATDRGLLRVEQLAEIAGTSVRTLQRRFADHVGISPKAVIRRYRIFDAAEAAREGEVDWARLAADLGYADQSHLVRDFRDAIGTTPAAYARAASGDGVGVGAEPGDGGGDGLGVGRGVDRPEGGLEA